MMNRLNGQVVIVTGAGAGIGMALARELLAAGSIVYACVRNLARAELDFADLANRSDFRILRLDINDAKAAEAAVATVLRERSRIDALVNNAGFGYYGAFENLTDEGFHAQFETNFFAALRLMRLVLPSMRERGAGLILNVTSILGRLVIPAGSAYCSSKWALEAVSEAVRYEVAPFGVRVGAVEPGLIRTEFKNNMEFATDAGDSYAYLNRKLDREYTGFATSARACARGIMRVMRRPYVPVRTTIGIDAKAYAFLRWIVPTALLDVLVRAYLRRARERAIL